MCRAPADTGPQARLPGALPATAGPGLPCSIFHPSLAPWHRAPLAFLLQEPSRSRGRGAPALPKPRAVPRTPLWFRCRAPLAPAPLPSPRRAAGSAPGRLLTDERRSQWRAGHVRATANGCRRAARGRGCGAGAARCALRTDRLPLPGPGRRRRR